jgi:hypothetical protein
VCRTTFLVVQSEAGSPQRIMEPAQANPAAMSAPTVQMSDFVLEQEIEESVASDEEAWDEEQCPALVACGHMTCANTFRDRAPEPVRFGTSSFFGSLAMFILNELVLVALPEAWMPNPGITVAWAISYAISIWVQHWLHATLVYGWRTSYVQGLITTYAGYSVSYLASIPINEGLVLVGCSATVAWALTLFLTGCANYFLFQRLLGGSKRPPVTPRGLYNPPTRSEGNGGLNAGMLSPEELHQQQLDTASSGSGRQMAAEYRRLQAGHGVSRVSSLDRFYVWVASW